MEMFVYSLSLFGAKLLTDVSLFKTKYRCMAAIPRNVKQNRPRSQVR